MIESVISVSGIAKEEDTEEGKLHALAPKKKKKKGKRKQTMRNINK
jgi:hypothetical protein